MKTWLKPLSVLFVLPVVGLVFFLFAPTWLENDLHGRLNQAIDKSTTLSDADKPEQRKFFDQLNISGLCASTTPDAKDAVVKLEFQSTCREFWSFDLLEKLSMVLIAVGLAHLAASAALAKVAGGSRRKLITAFKSGWSFSIVAALVILLGQTILAVGLLFYGTVLSTNSYFPQFLLALAVGGLWGFYQVVRLLLRAEPFELRETAVEPVSESQSPTLWQEVREVAKKLQTEPPDTILIGQSTSFYVTEADVVHAGGISRGRTLHLSAPLLKHMPTEEILAVIGHELGHFKGEDTKLSREFSPRFKKAVGTIELLAQSGVVGWPALQVVTAFLNLFDPVIASHNRSRELEADRAGSLATSTRVMAQSLVRVSYLSESRERTLEKSLKDGKYLSRIPEEISALVFSNDAFWSELGAGRQPHPVDSHPPLSMRLLSLGESDVDLRSLVSPRSPQQPAFDQWLGHHNIDLKNSEDEFGKLVESHAKRVQTLSADTNTLEGKTLLSEQFPTVLFAPSKGKIAAVAVPLLLLGLGLASLGLFIGGSRGALVNGGLISGALALIVIALVRAYWRAQLKESLTLNFDSLSSPAWTNPLLFSEIKQLRFISQNNIYTLLIDFNEKRAPLKRNAWFKGVKRRTAKVNLSQFQVKQKIVLETILRYFTRERD